MDLPRFDAEKIRQLDKVNFFAQVCFNSWNFHVDDLLGLGLFLFLRFLALFVLFSVVSVCCLFTLVLLLLLLIRSFMLFFFLIWICF
jgi:hypothetical protein